MKRVSARVRYTVFVDVDMDGGERPEVFQEKIISQSDRVIKQDTDRWFTEVRIFSDSLSRFCPTWKNTLRQVDGAEYGHISVIQDLAKMIKYDYFVWNGRVYTVEGKETEWTLNDLE